MFQQESVHEGTMVDWPELPSPGLQETCATLQLWTQIVGKIRLAQTPWLNHSWHVTLYVTPLGLSTSPIPDGHRSFQIDFDFTDQVLCIQTSDRGTTKLPLRAEPIADFHARLMGTLASLGIEVHIHGAPNEMAEAVPFAEDHAPRVYDPEMAHRFARALLQVDRVFKTFRTGFVGKSSPVHFFWGGADLAVTRFSGRRAPPHRGGVPHLPDAVAREAYSHEVSSAGFWPGSMGVDQASFYSYAYPEPPGFAQAFVTPAPATYHAQLGEFLLPYDAVRRAPDPDAALLGFLQSTYEAAANAAGWDRAALECMRGRPLVPRPVEAGRIGRD